MAVARAHRDGLGMPIFSTFGPLSFSPGATADRFPGLLLSEGALPGLRYFSNPLSHLGFAALFGLPRDPHHDYTSKLNFPLISLSLGHS